MTMKSVDKRSYAEHRAQGEALVERQVGGLFQRMPMLSGFCVRDHLELAEVTVSTRRGLLPGSDLYGELVVALAEMAEERPDAADFLLRRTFTRGFR